MLKLNRLLLSLLVFLLVFACAGTVLGADSGSGSIGVDDGSPTEEQTYGDDDNSIDSEDDSVDDPLDEAYYGDSDSSDDSISVVLSKHATSNPLAILLLALFSAGAVYFK